MMGLLADVYRTPSLRNATRGVSAYRDTVLVVGPGVSGPFESTHFDAILWLMRRAVGDETYMWLEPEGPGPWLAGGNFAYTADSRWPGGHGRPLPIHDRQE